MTMTSEAKGKLSKTIRALRERLLTDLSEATDREYKLSIRTPKLDTAKTARRKRLEDWLAEQARSETGKQKRTREDFRREAEQQAAHTLLNRLVILRVMEATGLRKPKVVTGGWNSQGYKDFRELAPALVRDDESEGYSYLLQLIFEDLATDLPGLYGSVGVADLIPVPSATIRAVVEAFDDAELESCWTDDMTLGWVYQYWNDPQREALDRKINEGGKIEPHEIASKTQMFTERYMVDWLLQNSLGPMWLAMCQKHGWTAEVESDGTLQRLEDRRVAWRAKRDERQAALASRSSLPERTYAAVGPGSGVAAGREVQPGRLDLQHEVQPGRLDLQDEVQPGRLDLQEDLPGVSLTDLMPLETDAERRWAYYVPQPIPDDAVEHAADSVRDLKILDPAVGSGHFLVVAFDLLVALYKEEARHRAAASLLPRAGGEGARRADEGADVADSVAENPPHPNPLPRSDVEPANESTLRGRGDNASTTFTASLLPRAGGEGARRADEGAVESDSVAENPPHPNPLPRGDVEPANESTLRGRGDNASTTFTPSLLPRAGGEGARRADEGADVADDVAENPPHPALSPAGEIQNMESRARGRGDMMPFNPADWSDVAIVERILEHNLHGIDLDSRAVQIAAAALWLKAQQTSPAAHPRQLNLVASNLGIASLPDNDPALVELRAAVEKETGIPAKLTNQIVEALRGADHLGSLLKVDAAIETAISQYEEQIGWKEKVRQIDMFPDGTMESKPRPISRDWAQNSVLAALELFLSQHTSAQELGLRLRGEQLAAGVRFVRLVKEGTYDLVVANPPYQGTSKMADAKYVSTHYKLGKADLFAAFLLRGLELVRTGGVSSMLTMRNWMFIKQYSDLRQHLLQTYDLRALGDLSSGAFQEINAAQVVVSVAMACFWRDQNTGGEKVALRPFDDETLLKAGETERKRAATLCHLGRHTFDPAALKAVPEWPLVYWWDEQTLSMFHDGEQLGKKAAVRNGLSTQDNTRFLRMIWEVSSTDVALRHIVGEWALYIKGAEGRVWFEDARDILRWTNFGLEVKCFNQWLYGSYSRTVKNEALYFQLGVAFSLIGSGFNARAHRYKSVFGHMGASVFPDASSIGGLTCLLNSNSARSILESLNPGVHFLVGDVNRLPVFPIANADEIFAQIESAFGVHESHREASVEFQSPEPSPWRHAQEWAQLAVDRPAGAALPEYVEELDREPPTDHLSFAVGVALGRFSANGEGILDPPRRAEGVSPPRNLAAAHGDDRGAAHGDDRGVEHGDGLGGLTPTARREQVVLPHGILFLDGSLGDDDRRDSLGHDATQIIHDNWTEYASQIDTRRSLRDWLREKFFSDVHRKMYENRPIHWPLSSAKKTFVAWVTIHRWSDQTLRVLLADHLEPALKRLDGEIADLTASRGTGDKKQARAAEQRFDDIKAWRDELVEFIANVQQCAERGPAPADSKKPEREVDARYIPDLDDGVMINSAALWPLLDPQWKDPKKWWKELVAAKGKKDYDWSHLAMKYWPTRVDQKCQTDPSLGVAHGCFWKYHPARAWAWELRLQDEIGPDFRIEEAEYKPGIFQRPFSADSGEKVAVRPDEGANRADKPPHPSPLPLKGRGDKTLQTSPAGRGDVVLRSEYLQHNPKEALAIIEKEVLRRRRKQKRLQTELRLLEPGLWSSSPADCWELELGLIDKQQVEFRLLSPDAPVARAAFETAHPELFQSRKALLSRLKPPDLYAEEEEDDLVAEVDEEITDDES